MDSSGAKPSDRSRIPVTTDLLDTTGKTMGVEEEFLLVDPVSFVTVPRASEVLAIVTDDVRPYLRHEFQESQVEIATPVCYSLAELRESLSSLRRAVQRAANQVGCRILAAGATIVPGTTVAPLVDSDRFRQISLLVGGLVEGPGVCACHVHVGVAGPAAAEVSNRIRPYLPVLQALGANSAVVDGRDTGFASWRSVLVDRWPGSGPAPYLHSIDDLDEIVTRLEVAGLIVDRGMLYWYARPSGRFPTVEIRASDVCLSVGDAVVMAGICRALVRTVAVEAATGVQTPAIADSSLRAAHWKAAKDGLEGHVISTDLNRVIPTWDAVDELLAYIHVQLAHFGDLDTVQAGLRSLRTRGSGAARQRKALARWNDPREVARHMCAATAPCGGHRS